MSSGQPISSPSTGETYITSKIQVDLTVEVKTANYTRFDYDRVHVRGVGSVSNSL